MVRRFACGPLSARERLRRPSLAFLCRCGEGILLGTWRRDCIVGKWYCIFVLGGFRLLAIRLLFR